MTGYFLTVILFLLVAVNASNIKETSTAAEYFIKDYFFKCCHSNFFVLTSLNHF